MDERQAISWLSEQRFTPFLAAVDHDHNRAVALYQWHLELSGATFSMIHWVEVIVRNAVDACLGAGQPQAPLSRTWLLDFEVLRPWAVKQVVGAVERIGGEGPIVRARAVAGLSFGFWVALFGRRYDGLWRERLHQAFPHGRPAREEVSASMRRIHQLRNRIAHHDCLLDQDVAGVVGEMLALAEWVDPAAAGWLRRAADAEGVLARRP